MEKILIEHYQRYPKMEVQDFVKLIYQNCFGPRHIDHQPDLERIKTYLKEELTHFVFEPLTPIEEVIGSSYVRISLAVLNYQILSLEDLAGLFHQSMLSSPIDEKSSISCFKDQLELLKTLILQKKINLNLEEYNAFVNNYYIQGIRAIHHSETYRLNYHPHYRVVERKILAKYKEKDMKVFSKKTKFKGIDKNPSLLGFGCMRFPRLDSNTQDIDEVLASQMIDEAYQAGVNYFDTAYPYHQGLSEKFLGKTLKKYPRDSFNLATKMPGWMVQSVEDAKKIFQEQLSNLQTTYFDYYLCHALSKKGFEIYQKPGIMDFLYQMKTEGKIKHLGFSFHDTPEVLDEIIHQYQWDFVQLQLNYLDWDFQEAKKQYQIVKDYGVPVIVMEPVRGGTLAMLSEEAGQILKSAEAKASLASWAIRYAATKEQVMVVLSGMSNLEQTRDNIQTLTYFKPITDQDQKVIDRALKVFLEKKTVPCTNCKYCMPCPEGVDIPGIFSIYNQYAIDQFENRFITQYQNLSEEKQAHQCIVCGKCVLLCPQSINIPKRLNEIQEVFEALLLKQEK